MSDKKKIEWAVTILMLLLSTVVVIDYLFRIGILHSHITGIEKADFAFVRGIEKIRPNMFFIRLMLACFMLSQGFFQKTNLKEGGKDLDAVLTYLTPVILCAFILGYLPNLFYNVYVYPAIFLSLFYLVPKVMGSLMYKDNGSSLSKVNKANQSDFSVKFKTEKGTLTLPNLRTGTGIEGLQNAGKTETLIMQILTQTIPRGFCGLIYDYKGDLTQPNGGKLCKIAYTALKNSKSEVKYALLNWQRLELSNQTNVFAPRYLQSFQHCKQLATAVLFNIERGWAKGQDKFWANNAIAVYSSTLWFFKRNHPAICTLPHITEFLLNDFKKVLRILSSDEDIAARMRPIVSALDNEAGPQLSGAEASTQFPTAIMRSPEIYWVFNPPEGKDLDLDLNNLQKPILLCIANNPDLSEALSPALGAVIQVCRMQLGRPGKHPKVLFLIDELPTIFIDKLDKIAAELREYGVCAVYAIQSFSQLVRDYTEIFARVVWGLGNIFTGMTDVESAKKISEMIGDFRKTEYSFSEGESGSSTSKSERLEKILKPSEIASQPPGHFSGRVAGGEPPFFSTQFDRFIYPIEQITPFGYPVHLDDEKKQKEILDKLVEENYERVKSQCRDLFVDYEYLFNSGERNKGSAGNGFSDSTLIFNAAKFNRSEDGQ